jgi:hypothetical protein
MSHTEFAHLLSTISALSPEQMRQLCRELETKLAATGNPPPAHDQGSLGAMRDAADELDEVVAHAMEMRGRQSSASPPDAATGHKPIWEVFQEISANVPDEVWDALPTDLSEQHDHYIYGTPKRTDP